MTVNRYYCDTCGRFHYEEERCSVRDDINELQSVRAQNNNLRAENEKLREDRDLWKISEETCNQNYNELLEENEKLRAVNKQMLEALLETFETGVPEKDEKIRAAIRAGEEIDD